MGVGQSMERRTIRDILAIMGGKCIFRFRVGYHVSKLITMRPYSQTAAFYRLAMQAGLATPEEVIAWADGILASSADYDDDLANIALAANASYKELYLLLGQLASGADHWEALRDVLSRMYRALVENPSRIGEFTHFLYVWIEHDDAVPDDLKFIISIDDEFGLARDGINGTVEGVTWSLFEDLKIFKERSTPP